MSSELPDFAAVSDFADAIAIPAGMATSAIATVMTPRATKQRCSDLLTLGQCHSGRSATTTLRTLGILGSYASAWVFIRRQIAVSYDPLHPVAAGLQVLMPKIVYAGHQLTRPVTSGMTPIHPQTV